MRRIAIIGFIIWGLGFSFLFVSQAKAQKNKGVLLMEQIGYDYSNRIDSSGSTKSIIHHFGNDSLYVTRTEGYLNDSLHVGVWVYYTMNNIHKEKADTFYLERKQIHDSQGEVQEMIYFDKRNGKIYKRYVLKKGEVYLEENYLGGSLRNSYEYDQHRNGRLVKYYQNGRIKTRGREIMRMEYKGCLGLWPTYYRRGLWVSYNENGKITESRFYVRKD